MYDLQEAYLGVYYDLDEANKAERMLGLTSRERERARNLNQHTDRPIFYKDTKRSGGDNSDPILNRAHKRMTAKRQKSHEAGRNLRGDTGESGNVVRSRYQANKNHENGYPSIRRVDEQLDLYDLIFDYLLDEGYANTEEAATVIMANMSEDWIDDIYEEVLDEKRNVTDRPLGILHRFARGVRSKGGEKTELLGSDREGNSTNKYYVMQHKKREAQREKDANEARRRDSGAMSRGTWDRD